MSATCSVVPPETGVSGMTDQVECRGLKNSSVVFSVARFNSTGAVQSYLDGLVTRSKYKKAYWTIDKKRRGLLVTSPTTDKFVSITSSVCDLPFFLVEFYAPDSAGLTEATVQNDYWAKATFPNTPPAVC
jgi:phage-related protein